MRLPRKPSVIPTAAKPPSVIPAAAQHSSVILAAAKPRSVIPAAAQPPSVIPAAAQRRAGIPKPTPALRRLLAGLPGGNRGSRIKSGLTGFKGPSVRANR